MNHAHNGKVERYQRILAEGLLYAREFDSKDERSGQVPWSGVAAGSFGRVVRR